MFVQWFIHRRLHYRVKGGILGRFFPFLILLISLVWFIGRFCICLRKPMVSVTPWTICANMTFMFIEQGIQWIIQKYFEARSRGGTCGVITCVLR